MDEQSEATMPYEEMEPPVEKAKKVFLTKTQILALDDRITEDVWVPVWKSFVRVRALTVGERDRYEADMLEGKGKNQKVNLTNARAKLIQLAVIDENGEPMFTKAEASVIAQKSSAAIEPLFEAARRLSAMTDDDIEELTGNSETSQS